MWQAPPAPVSREWLPVLDMPAPGPQNRWTVLLRALLLIPQFVVVWVLSVVAFFVTVIGWFGALVLGRLPGFAADYLTAFVPYETRVTGYLMLTVDRYPPFRFHAPDHPVQVELRPGELNRLAVLFRIVLVIPASIVQGLVYAGWWTVGFVSWLVVLVLGRMPQPLYEATTAILRYRMRYAAYLTMLSSAYPKRLFGEEPGSEPGGPVSATRPLVLGGAGRGLLVLFILLGVVSWVTSSVTTSVNSDDDDNDDVTNPTQHVVGPLVPGPAELG
ncbi:uncharacterized protein DUF4389 [Streptomyces sp. 1114.5]|uniref:DUF4389 domain-containing protein n=1 Tax=unclassified Streptomyces TaxID=2593676 RepID=UPI000BCD036E|nr:MULTISPECIES: DUF4389 domain-containing protein [unclassified Streptomyces]RKT09408.1 uncharacterized protein DUF4389 [Streptomyces sp. 1114.5]SOB88587.1 protein of unknown function [Streptomyces sp. 1331.2]